MKWILKRNTNIVDSDQGLCEHPKEKIPDGKRGIGDSGYKGEPTKMSVSRENDSKEVRQTIGGGKGKSGRCVHYSILHAWLLARVFVSRSSLRIDIL